MFTRTRPLYNKQSNERERQREATRRCRERPLERLAATEGRFDEHLVILLVSSGREHFNGTARSALKQLQMFSSVYFGCCAPAAHGRTHAAAGCAVAGPRGRRLATDTDAECAAWLPERCHASASLTVSVTAWGFNDGRNNHPKKHTHSQPHERRRALRRFRDAGARFAFSR